MSEALLKAARGLDIVLASGSAGRRGLLEGIGLRFRIAVSECGEDAAGSPRDVVSALARRKAEDVASRVGAGIVVGADTLVSLDGVAFGKPADRREAREMLRALSGRTHQVYTGVCVVDAASGRSREGLGESDVTFHALGDGEIEAYLDTGDSVGRAGAYAFQGAFRKHVASFTGEESNIIGLPCELLARLIGEVR